MREGHSVEPRNLDHYTGIGRELNLQLIEHRWMALFVLLGGLATFGYKLGFESASAQTAALSAAEASAGVFLVWALSRELDPDYPHSALVAAAVSIAASVWWDPASILITGWALLSLRIVARTSGVPPKPFDSVAATAAGLLLGALYGAEYLVLTAIVLALDGWLTGGLARHRWLAGLLALVSAGSLLWLPWTRPVFEPTQTGVLLTVAAVCLLFLLLTRQPEGYSAQGDYSAEPLDRTRVRSAQWLLVAGLGLQLFTGGDGLFLETGGWITALAGVAAYHLVRVARSYA